ncbi:MAG: Inner membrane protein YbaN [Hyphomonas sp. TMED17]|nr:MAG: Inner membrane protein YbaN [Hyphomonas sp. TMED17]
MTWILRAAGSFCLLLGGIGLFIPLWPTTIFWILAAILFARSHPPSRDWIYRQRGVGPQIKTFIETGTLNRTGKMAALSGVVIGGALSSWLIWPRMMVVAAMLVILALVAAYIGSRPNSRPD